MGVFFIEIEQQRRREEQREQSSSNLSGISLFYLEDHNTDKPFSQQ
jgi:hypothetical protein